jgi:Leucine-rich repeat (LRR) protein
VLDLSYNQIESLSTFQGELPKLVKLSLKKNKLKSLVNIGNFPALTYLKLSRNNLESLSELARLSKLKALKGISLYKNPLEEDRAQYTQAILAACPQLESLDHNSCTEARKRGSSPEPDGFQFKQDKDDRLDKADRPGSGNPRPVQP